MEPVISFNQPGYETLTLPSNGIGHQGLVSIQVRPMTMKEEKILTNKSLVKSNKFQAEIFKSVVGKGTTKDGEEVDVDLNRLLLEDDFALLLFVRAISYGREYKADVECPTCNEEYNVTIDLETDLKIEMAEEGIVDKKSIKLPHCGKTVLMRYPEVGDVEDSVVDTVPKLIVDVKDVNFALVDSWLETILAGDFAELRKAANKAPFGIEKTIKFKCENTECKKYGHVQEVDLPITANFFRL